MRIVVEKSGLQHHLFGIKSQAFVGAGVVIVTADGVCIMPTETELEIVPRNTLMNKNRSWIVRRGQIEKTQVRPRHTNVTGSILIEARRSCQVVGDSHILEGLEVGGQQQVAVM